jgi:hypothetical protein
MIVNAQSTSFAFTSAINREEQEKKLRSLVDQTITQPFSNANYSSWKSACWAMELMLYKPIGYKNRIPALLKSMADYDANLQWILLQNIFTLYPKKFASIIAKQCVHAKNDKVKALMMAYCNEANREVAVAINDPFFQTAYHKQLIAHYSKSTKTGFKEQDFLSPNFLSKENVLISFQHRDRNIPGYLMIRTEHGDWLKDSSGKPLRFTQLARSITNMPYFLTNGNTPQGLYRVNGFDISSNSWIGPTTNLQIVMPFEAEVSKPFFTDTTNATSSYGSLLGSFAKNNELWESYWAGLLGRSEIIAHGTTIPEWFYKEQPYYPCTPSLGCLCSPEIWDKNGKLVSSVQQQWIQLVQQLPAKPNWLLVVEL